MRKQTSHSKKSADRTERMRIKNPNAAGIDVGARQHFIAVPGDRSRKRVRSFGNTTPELEKIVDWLQQCSIETVAMESTGVYWIPLYELLEERGIEVYLVNARHLRNVPGRKTDVADCQWIQELHTFGLLRASFRPGLEICEFRSYLRQRQMLIQWNGAETQHMQKALALMNVRLDTVITDVTGTTGMAIIRDIMEGHCDPKKLATHRDPRCKATERQIQDALTGNYRSEHVFALRQAVEAHDFLQRQVEACDKRIEGVLTTLAKRFPEPETQMPEARTKRKKPTANEPKFDMRTPLYRMTGCDLTQINGIGPYTALNVISEIGTDVSPWPTEKHFTSWLSLCPGNNITGGKRRRSKKEPTASRVAQSLRIAAMTLGRTDTALGAYYRRMAARLGAGKAVAATARKLAVMIYNMLRNGTQYVDPGADNYDHRQRQRILKSLRRRAQALGFELVTTEASPATL